MLENFLFCLTAISPCFLLMAVGFGIRELGWFPPASVGSLNRLCFRFLIPLSLFRTAYHADLSTDFSLPMIVLSIGMYTLSTLFAVAASRRLTVSPGVRGSIIQGAFRSNIVLLGLPFVINMFGEQNAGMMGVLVTFLVPYSNVLAVIVFSYFTDTPGAKTDCKTVAKNLLRNPMLVAACFGFVFALTGWQLPSLLTKPLFDLAATATPLSMLVIGALLYPKSVRAHLPLTLFSSGIKLLLIPLVGVSTAIFLGMRGNMLAAVFFAMAAPSAAACSSFAEVMGGDVGLSAEIVAFTTMASAVTIFLGSFLLKTVGMI